MQTENNPFKGCKAIVEGEGFVGREEQINELNSHIFDKNFNNVAIVGIPHIGKSSLMNTLYLKRKELWIDKRNLVVWHTLKKVNKDDNYHRFDLFLSIASQVYSKLKKLCPNDDFIEDLAEYMDILTEKDIRWFEFEANLKNFFETIVDNNIRVITCLDEFDYAKDYLQEAEYQLLRELSYVPSYRVSLITTSRRSIYDIEHYSGGGSNLFMLFENIYLKPFTKMEHYLQCKKILFINECDIDKLWSITGGHPFINSILLEKYWTTKDVNKALFQAKQLIYKYYDDLFYVLKKDGLDDKVDRLYCGYTEGVTEQQRDYIYNRYGIFVDKKDESYIPFSSIFEDYLKCRYKNIPFTDVWPETERALRKSISSALAKHFNTKDYATWVAGLSFIDDIPKDRLNIWKGQMHAEKTKYGAAGSPNIINQLYPKDFQIFFKLFWDECLSDIYGKDLFYWLNALSFIADDIRNPFAHSRKGLLSEKEQLKATLICQEIIDCVIRKK